MKMRLPPELCPPGRLITQHHRQAAHSSAPVHTPSPQSRDLGNPVPLLPSALASARFESSNHRQVSKIKGSVPHCRGLPRCHPVVKKPPTNAGDMSRRFDPWVGKIPWRRSWQPTPVFWPGESHGQKSLAGYRLRVQGRKESDTTKAT